MKILVFRIVLIGLSIASFAQAQQPISLGGEWRFALDRKNEGVDANWFNQSLQDRIKLPGILQSQGFGDEITATTPWVLSLYDRAWNQRDDYKEYTKPGNVKVPFLSQPPRHYIGAAWYQRDITIPEGWRGKRVVFEMERPRWETTVWLNDRRVGSRRSLVAPHEYDLGVVEPGTYRLSVRVDTSMILPYRPDAHAVSDSLGMSWNGITGDISLKATSPVWIDDAQIFATSQTAPVAIKVTIGNSTGKSGSGFITANGFRMPVTWTADPQTKVEIKNSYPINGRLQSWNEFTPALSKMSLSLKGDSADDRREISFGYRDIKAVGKEFQLNGRRIYLRGTHHGGDFPLTGYAPTDIAYWRKLFQINKDWGINHVRFHSFCPPEAAFVAADELGIYLQPEPGMWNEVSPGTEMEKMLYEETELMIRAYGNHPSFLLFSPSNEPKGRWKEAFDKWIAHYRIADPRRLYTNGTGHTEREVPGLAEGADYLAMQRIGPKMLRGNAAWFGKDYGASLDDINVPVVSHELGQWVAYPDYDVIKKFTGYMRPGNYEIFRDSLAAKGMLARNKDFAIGSGKFQLAAYKEEIEANLRTPGMDGFQLLDLHDYLGQGTALVGLLDPFWEEKGYVTAKEFRRFNSETVPLARIDKTVLFDKEQLHADLEIAHFGKDPIKNAAPYWKIVDAKGAVFAGGDLPRLNIPIGKNIPLGKLEVALSRVTTARAFKLKVGLKGTTIENEWNIWVYPFGKTPVPEHGVVITHSWDEAEAKLAEGMKVLYMPRRVDLGWTSPPLDWVPVFWNRLMNPAWGRMLGLWIDNRHPALAKFPTDSHYDWQWSGLVNGARAINMDRLPKELQPIVQPIDDWNRNYKLGLIFEARVGAGKLIVSSIDLENNIDRRLSARQLCRSVLDYMASPAFDPKVSLTPENFREVLFETRIMKRLGAATAASDQPSEAFRAIDGDPNTFWIAGDPRAASRRQHQLTIAFGAPVAFSGLVLMPRQNHREHEGDIRDYAVFISEDNTNWREVKRGELLSTYDPQRVEFGATLTARYIKFVSLSGFGADKVSALAEVAIVYAGPKLPPDESDVQYTRNRSASPDIDEGVPAEERKVTKPE